MICLPIAVIFFQVAANNDRHSKSNKHKVGKRVQELETNYSKCLSVLLGKYMRRSSNSDELIECEHYSKQIRLIINKRDSMHNTPLHYAALNWPQTIVRKLLNNGANVGMKNLRQEIPLSRISPETLQDFLDENCMSTRGYNLSDDEETDEEEQDEEEEQDDTTYDPGFLTNLNNEDVTFKYEFLAPPVTEDQLKLWDPEKQKELESHQRKISWKQYLHQSRKDGLENMRTKLLNLQTQYKVLHMQTDSHRKLLDETKQRHSMDDLEVEHDKLESEIETKQGEIADLKKQKQLAMQQTEQITQKISEQQKQLADHTDVLSSHLEMLEKQKTAILEEIAQAQAKKQAQEDELQALTKERLGLVSKNKDKQGMDEQIQKHRDRLHAIQNERSMLELEIKSQMILLNQERKKEKEIMASILQKYN